MKDLTIAITNVYNDTVTMLPVVGELPLGNKAMFHNNPLVDFNGREIVRNFDYHFDFALKQNRFHKDLLPHNYFHFPRLKRMTQYINIYHFNEAYKDKHDEIFIPEFYTATQRAGEHVTMANFSLPQGDKVVIKEQFGARGSNQVVVPSNMVTTLLKHSKGLTMAEVKVKFPDFIYSDGTTWDKVMFEKPSDLFISQLVPSVKSEWRLLVGGDKIYGRERMIKQGPYPQANLDHDVFVTVPEVKYELIENMFSEELVSALHDLTDFIGLPIGSIDLFLTEDGRYGIFEYSTQFAFMGADNNFIRQMLLDGLWRVISFNTPTNELFDLNPESPDTCDDNDYVLDTDIDPEDGGTGYVDFPPTYSKTSTHPNATPLEVEDTPWIAGDKATLDEFMFGNEHTFVKEPSITAINRSKYSIAEPVSNPTQPVKRYTSEELRSLINEMATHYDKILANVGPREMFGVDPHPPSEGVIVNVYTDEVKSFHILAQDMSLMVVFSNGAYTLTLNEKKGMVLNEYIEIMKKIIATPMNKKTVVESYASIVNMCNYIAPRV